MLPTCRTESIDWVTLFLFFYKNKNLKNEAMHLLSNEGVATVDQLWPRYWMELCSGALLRLIAQYVPSLLMGQRRS